MEVFCTSKVVSRCFLSAVWVFPDIKWFDDQIWCTTPRLFGCCPTAVAGLIFFGWGHLQAICRPFDRPCVARGYSFPHETGKIKIETPTWISHHQWSLTFYTPAISESFINRGPFSNRSVSFSAIPKVCNASCVWKLSRTPFRSWHPQFRSPELGESVRQEMLPPAALRVWRTGELDGTRWCGFNSFKWLADWQHDDTKGTNIKGTSLLTIV